MEEIWKWFPEWEGFYEISSYGRVRSVKSGRIIKTFVDNHGYIKVHICKLKRQGCYRLNVVMARVFLNHLPCGNKLVVIYKDGDKTNNRADNLLIAQNGVHKFIGPMKKMKKSKYSDYPGVTIDKITGKWRAYLSIDHKERAIGTFKTEEEAAEAYRVAYEKRRQYYLAKYESK